MTKLNNHWDLAPLASSDEDPALLARRAESEKLIQKFYDNWIQNTDYLNDPQILRQALDQLEEIERTTGLNSWEWYYFNLRSAQDQLDPTIKAKYSQASDVATRLYNKIQFFDLSLSKLPSQQQQELLKSDALRPFHHYLDRIFALQPHTLSEKEEKVINLLEAPARNAWISMTSSLLSKVTKTIEQNGKPNAKSFAEILSLTSNRNKQVRDAAALHVHQVTRDHADIATEELNAILSHKKTIDELRNFTRPDQARHMSDDIESEVVDQLVSQVSSRFDIPHRFYQLKASLLSQESLAYHERNVPVGEIRTEYPYDKAETLVGKVLTSLDRDFGGIFDQFRINNQIDVYPSKGKSGGAFCAHSLISQPTYILLNHTDTLQDVLTLAHEVGHGIHSELARKTQNSLNFGTSLATAEVSSTFMEDFILEELLNEAVDQGTRTSIGMMKLNDDVSSIFRQIACYKFETELHQTYRRNGYLSKDEIGEIFSRHMKAYMGPAVSQDEGGQHWWVYWSHIRNYFYVYSYASGLLISKSLQNIVRADKKDITLVKQFMQAGQSASPTQIFASIGIDITSPSFWDKGLNEIDNHLKKLEQQADNESN